MPPTAEDPGDERAAVPRLDEEHPAGYEDLGSGANSSGRITEVLQRLEERHHLGLPDGGYRIGERRHGAVPPLGTAVTSPARDVHSDGREAGCTVGVERVAGGTTNVDRRAAPAAFRELGDASPNPPARIGQMKRCISFVVQIAATIVVAHEVAVVVERGSIDGVDGGEAGGPASAAHDVAMLADRV